MPKAIPIERCFFGVTTICSATKIEVNRTTPHHNNQLCGKWSAKSTNAATLMQCSAILMYKDVATEKCEGIECKPRLRSKSASCKAYIMSKPPHQVKTNNDKRHTAQVSVPVTAINAPAGAIANDRPSTRCASEVKRLQ